MCHTINMLELRRYFQQLVLHQHISYAGWGLCTSSIQVSLPAPRPTPPLHPSKQWDTTAPLCARRDLTVTMMSSGKAPLPATGPNVSTVQVSPPPLWHNTATLTSYSTKILKRSLFSPLFLMTSLGFSMNIYIYIFFLMGHKAFNPHLCIWVF